MRRTVPEGSRLPEDLERALKPFERRMAARRALEGFAATGCIAWASFAAALVLDRLFLLSHGSRIALTAGALCATALAALWAVARCVSSRDPVRLAWMLEARAGGRDERIPSAVEISLLPAEERLRTSGELFRALVEDARAAVSRLRPRKAVPLRRPAAGAIASFFLWLATGAVLASNFFSARELAARFFHPSLDLPRPSSVELEISPGDAVAARGSDLRIEARALRGAPRKAWIEYRPDGGGWRREELELVAESRGTKRPRFQKDFRSLRTSLEYRIGAADFLSRSFRVLVRKPPRPVSFRVTYRFPEYAGLEPITEIRDRGDLVAVAGTTATVEVEADEELARADIEWFSGFTSSPPGTEAETGARRELRTEGARAKLEEFLIERSGGYRLFLFARDGISNSGRHAYAVRALADNAPSVEILEPKEEEVSLGRRDFLTIRYEARDDLGLASLEAIAETKGRSRSFPVWSAAGGAARSEDSRSSAVTKELRSSFDFDLRSLDLEPGALVSVHLVAKDRRGLEARSRAFRVTIRAAPPPPEGPLWPRPLRDLEFAISSAQREWAALLTSQSGPESDSRNLPERARSVRRLVATAAEEAFETARSLAIPSPASRRLEASARRLLRLGERSTADFGEPERAWKETAAGLEDELRRIRSLLVEEELDEFLEGALALEREAGFVARDLEGQETAVLGASPERAFDLASQSGRLAAELASAAAREAFRALDAMPRVAETLEDLSARLLDPAFREASRGAEPRRRAADIARQVAERLSREYDRAIRAAREAFEVREEDEVAKLLSALAAQESGEAREGTDLDPSLLRAIAIEIGFELKRLRRLEPLDPYSTGDLIGAMRILETASESKDRALLGALARAYETTAPWRSVEAIAQELSLAAGAAEELARGAAESSARSYEETRFLIRAQRDLARFLEGAEDALAQLAGELSRREGAGTAGAEFRAESERLARIRAELTDRFSEGAESLRAAALRLREVRSRAFPEATAARAWIAALVGSPAARAHRLAKREVGLAEDIRALAARSEPCTPEEGRKLASAQERLREQAATLAEDIRLGIPSPVGSPTDRERAALALLAIAAGDLAPIGRHLGRVVAEDASSQPGALLRIAERACEAAGKLQALASALEDFENTGSLKLPEELFQGSAEKLGHEPPVEFTERALSDAETLAAIEELELEMQRLFDRVSEGAEGAESVAKLLELGAEVDRSLRENFVGTSELVELVASLVLLEREASEIAARERSLAAELESLWKALPEDLTGGRKRIASVREEQSSLVEKVRGLLASFDATGLRLSSLLPLALRAFAQARDLSSAVALSAGDALDELRRIEAALGTEADPGDIATAASRFSRTADGLEKLAEAMREMRRLTFQAILDAERGLGGPNEAHLKIEEAKGALAQALELLATGDLRRAQLAQSASLRSIAEARAALRKRLEALAVPEGFSADGSFLGEEAKALGLEWKQVLRGDEPPRIRTDGGEESMPFPAQFRRLVRVYLEAISREVRR